MSVGASQLFVAIPQAFPKRPDIAASGQVPGGVFVPCTPIGPAFGGTAPLVNRNEYRLDFQIPAGFILAVKRIHVKLPVLLVEDALETLPAVTEIHSTTYASETEAVEAAAGKGGNPGGEAHPTTTRKPISPTAPYEFTNDVATVTRSGTFVLIEHKLESQKSVLPCTPTIVTRLKGPEGEMWSESFEVPLRYLSGTAGVATGTGVIDAYADLQNALSIDPGKTYSLAFAIFIPSTELTNPQLGTEIHNGTQEQGSGGVTLFYDIEHAPVGK
jgi:hypothetical protein